MRWLSGLLGTASAPQLDVSAWTQVLEQPVFAGLSPGDRARLMEIARQLLADKTFTGAGGLEVADVMATHIAAHAALLVLNLDGDIYRGWQEIIVYPGEFVPDRELMDETGVVHHVRHPMSGEAWEGGPLVLSWPDVEVSGLGEGYDVVIHEFAHKLDMTGGGVNGLPALHAEMRIADWSAAFSKAYEDFCQRVDGGEETAIDPYAAESPAEFFAVLAEYFFDWPEAVYDAYPAVYAQLKRYFRQDPLLRAGALHK